MNSDERIVEAIEVLIPVPASNDETQRSIAEEIIAAIEPIIREREAETLRDAAHEATIVQYESGLSTMIESPTYDAASESLKDLVIFRDGATLDRSPGECAALWLNERADQIESEQ